MRETAVRTASEDFHPLLYRPTCGQEAVSRKHQLRANLHLALTLLFKGGEVPLILVGVHFFPVSVVSWKLKG